MDYLYILAQTTEASETTTTSAEGTVPIDFFWEQITALSFPEAITFIAFGTVCLMYGWRLFKALVVISFALLGMAGGALAAEKISGSNHQILGGLIGLVLIGLLSLPLMKWGVSILGALAGGVITSGLWYACELPEQYIWAGSLVGIVAGGMIAFIALKWAVMLFSCLGGSAIFVTGFLALFYLWSDTQQQVQELVFDEQWFLPVALIVPTVVGFILQYKFIKKSAEWSL